MKRYTHWELAQIRAQRLANAARMEAEEAERRERATTRALFAAVILGTVAWGALMIYLGRKLIGE